MKALFFSIVIPTYNRAGILKKTIESVLSQTYPHFELIVVNDGSTDNTEVVVNEIIKHSQNDIKYIYQPNGERARARNTGFKNCKGNYVMFFDSDDLLYTNHLETAAAYIEHNKQPAFIHLRYDVKDSKGNLMFECKEYKSPPNKQLVYGNFLSCNGVFLRHDVAAQNPFNEDRSLSAMEDWELWLRLAAKYPLQCVNTITSCIVNHEERSVTQTQKEALIRRIEAIINYITTNKEVSDYYGSGISKFKATCYSYVALHLSLTGKHRKETARYLALSIFKSPSILMHKRFFAVLRRLF